MHSGKFIFSQITDHLPQHMFRKCVDKYNGNRRIQSFSCLDQFLCMLFAQLTARQSLRETELCLRVHGPKLYHMGFRGQVSRNTLANANKVRDWRIYADFGQKLIEIARPMYHDSSFGIDLKNTVYALDSSTIDLCLSIFPWAVFRSTKSAVKLHMLLDIRGNIPSFVHISVGKLHDVNVLDVLVPEPGSFYVMDRAYVDFKRLSRLDLAGSFFITRAKSNLNFRRVTSRSVEKSAGLRCDQDILLVGKVSKRKYPERLRRIRYRDLETGKKFVFLTNNFALDAQQIPDLYRRRWQVELFFKWIKQHLRIKSFFGTSENAVKTQLWIAICTYVLLAIIKKRLDLPHSLHTILQVVSLCLFEQVPLSELLTDLRQVPEESTDAQLELFGVDLSLG